MPSTGRLRFLEALPPPSTSAKRHRGALVLLHAFPLNARMWEPQLSLAEHGWRVIAPHVRGVDGAASDPPATTMDDYVADLIDLLDALHIEDAVVAGLSMGGYLALATFRKAPNYFKGLVLADTRAEADTADGLEARKRMLALVRDQGAEAVADAMISKLLGPTTLAQQSEVVQRVRQLVLSNSVEAISGGIRAMMSRTDSTPFLSSIRIPTLVLVGDEDGVTPPSAAEQIHAHVPGSELVRIPQSGHLSNLEQPQAFNAAVARFLDHRV